MSADGGDRKCGFDPDYPPAWNDCCCESVCAAWSSLTLCVRWLWQRGRACVCARKRTLVMTFNERDGSHAIDGGDCGVSADGLPLPNVDAFEIGSDRFVCHRDPRLELHVKCPRGRPPWHAVHNVMNRLPALRKTRFVTNWKTP